MPHPDAPPIVLPDPWLVAGFAMRSPVIGDCDRIVAAAQDPDIVRFTRTPTPYTRTDAEAYVAAAAQGLAVGSGVFLVLADPDGPAVHGLCGLGIDWRDAIGEVGYWLAPASRGRGLALRAVAAICQFGFDLGVGKISLQAAVNNTGSVAVATRLGFTLEGTLRKAGIDGGAGDLTAPRVDMHLFGLLPGELVPPAVPTSESG